jgi:hypothetical protein
MISELGFVYFFDKVAERKVFSVWSTLSSAYRFLTSGDVPID